MMKNSDQPDYTLKCPKCNAQVGELVGGFGLMFVLKPDVVNIRYKSKLTCRKCGEKWEMPVEQIEAITWAHCENSMEGEYDADDADDEDYGLENSKPH